MDITAIGGPLISAGASLIGSKMTADASNKAARLNAIFQAQEGERARAFELSNALRQEENQREFAKMGIQWRVADARAAGIHPMAALGAQTSSFSPISVGAHPNTSSPYAGASMGSGVAAMGQDISRAIQATRTQEQREDAYSKTVQDLQIQNMKLNNAVLASQVAKMNSPGTPPAFPTAGGNRMASQGDTSARVKMKPQEVIYSSKENPVIEPKAITDVGHAQTGKNRYFPVPAKDVKERIEDNVFAEAMWTVRNNLAPAIGLNSNPPAVPLKSKEHTWFMNPFTGEYRQRRLDWLDKTGDAFSRYVRGGWAPKTPWQSNWK